MQKIDFIADTLSEQDQEFIQGLLEHRISKNFNPVNSLPPVSSQPDQEETGEE